MKPQKDNTINIADITPIELHNLQVSVVNRMSLLRQAIETQREKNYAKAEKENTDVNESLESFLDLIEVLTNDTVQCVMSKNPFLYIELKLEKYKTIGGKIAVKEREKYFNSLASKYYSKIIWD